MSSSPTIDFCEIYFSALNLRILLSLTPAASALPVATAAQVQAWSASPSPTSCVTSPQNSPP